MLGRKRLARVKLDAEKQNALKREADISVRVRSDVDKAQQERRQLEKQRRANAYAKRINQVRPVNSAKHARRPQARVAVATTREGMVEYQRRVANDVEKALAVRTLPNAQTCI
jgi:hypothetical protein